MKKEVRCESCRKKIKDGRDLNIRFFLGIKPRVNCNECYEGKIKKKRKYLYGHSPWRGLPFNKMNNKKYITGLIVCSFILIILIILYRTNYEIIPKYIGGVLIASILLISWYWIMFSEARKIIKSVR